MQGLSFRREERLPARSLFPLLLCLLMPVVAFSADKTGSDRVIRWLVPDYPPGYIAKGSRAGKGQGDRVLNWFQDALPEYEHRVRRESMARTMGLLASPESAFCIPAFPAFEHLSDVMARGRAIGVVPPLRLITLRDNLDNLPVEDGEVSLEALLDRQDLDFAVLEGRDYLDLEPLIRERRSQPNIVAVSPGSMVESLFGMLFSGRVDYLVEHGFMLPYVRSLEPDRGSELVMLPLREGEQAVILYPLCRDNPRGREVLRKLDELTATPTFHRMMDESFRRVLPEQELEEFERLREQHLNR